MLIADQPEPERNRVDAVKMGKLVDGARDDEDVARVLGSTPLAERDARGYRHVAEHQVGHEPGRELEVVNLGGRPIALQIDFTGMACDFLLPVTDAAFLRGCAHALHVAGPEVVVADVVFPTPQDLYRTPHLPREQDGVHDEVGVIAPAEGAARTHHVNRHVFRLDAQYFRYGFRRHRWILRRHPHLGRVAVDTRRAIHRLHGDVSEIRELVDDIDIRVFHDFVAILSYNKRLVIQRVLELLHQLVDVVALLGQLPFDLQFPCAIERCPGVCRQHGDA